MAEIKYTANRDIPENIAGVEKYSAEDTQLISSFEINSSFDPSKHVVELHLLTLNDEVLFSEYDYRGYRQLGNAQSSGQEGTSILTIDPIQDSISFDYGNGGIKLLYHFLNDLYTDDTSFAELYIQDISPDRTELKLASLALSPTDLERFTNVIKSKLESEAFFNEFRLNFEDNDLLIGINIDTLDNVIEKEVVVKLYEPLPFTYGIKSKLRIVELVANSSAYEVQSEITPEPVVLPTLKPANFNIEVQDENIVPTQYFNYDELFSYPVNNANSQLFSLVNEKGVDISIDHTSYSDFIHFSSAQERLINFKYKLDLVTSYSASLSAIDSQTPSTQGTLGLQGISGSRTYFEGLMEGVLNNFDHYERFLYYESGSFTWPKSNTKKPYQNQISSTPESILWYSNQIAEAISYDNTNYSSLIFSIPSYLREDINNENYLTFIHMIGQHFDNLWLYADAVTDKYDADNRMNKGISKDLVGEALKNFGVKLYTSNKSIEDLFSSFVGQGYVSGSETIVNYITGSLVNTNTSIKPSSFDDYQKEIQKRIYHNLSYLLKTKGTERGLRALINCFGIPSDILDIKLYGGRNTNERPFYGDYQYYTSSLDKIRLDHTGSIVEGSTLSRYTSILKRDNKYTDDLHVIEVGFSPTDNVDKYIISKSLADPNLSTFNIDQYIGDPSNLTLPNYDGLYQAAEDILGDLSQYDVRAFVRLIKFFDNIIFKMVKDFIPARAVADTGIIIKPNLLNRSKAKSVKASVDTILSASMDNAFTYTSSIDTAFTEGKHGNTFGAVAEYTASYRQVITTPLGLALISTKNKEEAKFDGEFSNSRIRVTDGELNRSNTLKKSIPPKVQYGIKFFLNPPAAYCTLDSNANDIFNITPGVPYNLRTLLGTSAGLQAPTSTVFRLNGPSGTVVSSPYTFTGAQYSTIPVYADAGTIEGAPCTETALFRIVTCTLGNSTSAPTAIIPGVAYNLNTWFTLNQNIQIEFEIKRNSVVIETVDSITAETYQFSGTQNDSFTITVIDQYDSTCRKSVQITFFTCAIQPESGTVISRYTQFISNPILVDLTELFQGQVAGAQYYTQVITPLLNNSTQPSTNPTNWTLVLDPMEFLFNTGHIPIWVKLVNVPTDCEGYIKLVKTSATIGEGSMLLQMRNTPFLACGYTSTNTGIANNQGAIGNWEPVRVYFQTISDQPPMNTLQQLWNYGKRLYTKSWTGIEMNVNYWLSDQISSGPYNNGLPSTTQLNYYYSQNGITPPPQPFNLVSCYSISNTNTP
ncbi:hypothetical protein immuto35A_161 [Flavobacterium phage vB_FspM_immuto_3-5A]|uniref:Uncharacterized protein n=1 Tax=Flavobacterium phage vB_FspM_immuto_2-6A TaxID=2801477 RepID=A0A7T8ERH1_9CAUD|nr:hypothetical protein KNV73_gp109 [Flavobacterium phage vB_FspM_immuto_2-6A]QQO91841.1 hypothetical protein immuto26A_162 [Flavobacterium phage vB_FspM_immuto_2-6A]QQO92079.1 hypothetical protein immuto35A_161 [Flavobacterium phage vB_FspM_immuto_3-5A]QQO92317.1 hypothetical protein immuto136C_161 [Flavobacterium phage vB_FspM_immuto_13-6C]